MSLKINPLVTLCIDCRCLWLAAKSHGASVVPSPTTKGGTLVGLSPTRREEGSSATRTALAVWAQSLSGSAAGLLPVPLDLGCGTPTQALCRGKGSCQVSVEGWLSTGTRSCLSVSQRLQPQSHQHSNLARG